MTTETPIYDRYSQEVERLTREPGLIDRSWWAADPLFQFAQPFAGEELAAWRGDNCCGCITQIRNFSWRCAWTPSLTDEIKSDSRIPRSASDITPQHLPIFAEWQRKLDRELNRTPPPLLPSEAKYLPSINIVVPDMDTPQGRRD